MRDTARPKTHATEPEARKNNDMQTAEHTHTAAVSQQPHVAQDRAVTDSHNSLNHYQIIRRNGAVVPFEPAKIAVAMMKAFLAVHGTQGAASASVRETVDVLTQNVVRALMRSRPGGGTFHIEDVQDQVELGLMRGGHHEVARAYVLYREKRTQERAKVVAEDAPPAPVLHVMDGGQRVALDMRRLTGLIESACAGLGVDNLYVDITAEEVPILDGSAASFVFLLQSAGIELQKAPKKFLRVLKTVEIRDTTGRPTAKWQMQDLPPDPRYPSFASMRPGVDPRTGKVVVAGAYGHNSDTGAAYVFSGSDGSWTQAAELTAADGTYDEVSRDPAVVEAYMGTSGD